MKRFLDQFDPEGHEDVIGGALCFLKKHLNELEDKLNFWKVDPQFWSLDIEVMRNTLFYIESQRTLSHEHKSQAKLACSPSLDHSPAKSEDTSWDRQSELSKSGVCTCDHDAEMDKRHLRYRRIISDLRKRVIALNESTAESLMDNVTNDRIMVDMQETIIKLQGQIQSQGKKCKTHVAIIHGLKSRVSSLESLHLGTMFSSSERKSGNEFGDIEPEEEDTLLSRRHSYLGTKEDLFSTDAQHDYYSIPTMSKSVYSSSMGPGNRLPEVGIKTGDTTNDYYSVPSKSKSDCSSSLGPDNRLPEVSLESEETTKDFYYVPTMSKSGYSLSKDPEHRIPEVDLGTEDTTNDYYSVPSKSKSDYYSSMDPEHRIPEVDLGTEDTKNDYYSGPSKSKNDYYSSKDPEHRIPEVDLETEDTTNDYYSVPSKSKSDYYSSKDPEHRIPEVDLGTEDTKNDYFLVPSESKANYYSCMEPESSIDKDTSSQNSDGEIEEEDTIDSIPMPPLETQDYSFGIPDKKESYLASSREDDSSFIHSPSKTFDHFASCSNRDEVYPRLSASKVFAPSTDKDEEDFKSKENDSPSTSSRVSIDDSLPTLSSVMPQDEKCIAETPNPEPVRTTTIFRNSHDFFPSTRLSRINYYPMSLRNRNPYFTSPSRTKEEDSKAFK